MATAKRAGQIEPLACVRSDLPDRIGTDETEAKGQVLFSYYAISPGTMLARTSEFPRMRLHRAENVVQRKWMRKFRGAERLEPGQYAFPPVGHEGRHNEGRVIAGDSVCPFQSHRRMAFEVSACCSDGSIRRPRRRLWNLRHGA